MLLAGHARPNRRPAPVVGCLVDHHDPEQQTGLRRDRALVDQAAVAAVAVAAVAPVAVVRRQSDVVGDMNGS